MENLGSPLRDVLLLGGDVGPGPNGETVIWSASSSEPAVLNAVDPNTGDLVDSYDLPDAGGSWTVEVSADGSVYVGTYSSSHLFRWSAETGLVDLGNPDQDGNFVWALTSDDDGVVYGGMSPNGAVFSYDPSTESFRDYGRLSEADYVHSVAYADGVVYAGTSRPSTVFAVDPISGESQALPDPPGVDPDAEYVYDLNASDGYLYARFGEAFPDPLYVYDLAAEEWVDTIENAHGLDVTDAGPDGAVYLIVDGELSSYDPDTGVLEGVGVPFTGRVANTRGIGLAELSDPDFPGTSVVGLLWRGTMFRYSPETGAYDFLPTGIEGTPIPVQSLAEGPNGTMHVGGFLSGGFATLDLSSGERESFHTFAQLEFMTTHEDTLYLGAYPDARLYAYDPASPWNSPEYSPSTDPNAPDNPRQLVNLLEDEQVRAGAVASAGDYVALGTEPALNRYGGVFLLWDPATETVAYSERGLIEDQSIVALTYRDGVIYGASSIYGGYSATEPRAAEAVVFAWSVADQEMLWQTVPVPGAPTVEDLAFDADGTLWGTADGELFALDVATQDILQTVDGPGSAQQVEYDATSGLIYVDWGASGFGSVDPSTGEWSVAGEQDPGAFVADSAGRLWFSVGTEVLRYLPAESAPSVDGMRTALEQYVADGAVAGPMAHQLANALDQVERHLEGGRDDAASVALDRTIWHLDHPKQPDTLAAAAAEDLRGRAVALQEQIE